MNPLWIFNPPLVALVLTVLLVGSYFALGYK